MGVLMFTARVHDLMHRKGQIQYDLAKITRRMGELHKYAAMVGNGSISIGQLLAAPGSMMGRSMAYLAYAHNTSMQYMQQNAPMMMQLYGQQMGLQNNPQQAAQMQNYIMRSLYTQAREKVKEIEEKNLHEEEARLGQEKEKLQTEYDEVKEELEAAKKARDEGIKDMAPKYTGNG